MDLLAGQKGIKVGKDGLGFAYATPNIALAMLKT